MNEQWNRTGDYVVRSKDEKYKVKVEYWEHYGQSGVHIDIRDKDDNILHVFSLLLERDITNGRID